MIIQEVVIENYLCYYNVKKFAFSEGLNIILGENGEGKTKFFEALDWLFKGDSNNLDMLVSAKKLAEMQIDESFRVRVSISVKQHTDLKILTRQFIVKKKGENRCETSSQTLEGIEETNSGERNQVDGKRLMEQVFPTTIRRYSMFKGEAALDIFDQTDTLITLINTFSEAKHYDKYSEKGGYLKVEAEKAVDSATKNATKNKAEYTRLETDIKILEDNKFRAKTFLDSTEDQIKKIQENLEDVENFVSNAEALEIVNKRISDIKSKIEIANGRIHEDYTTSLFDEKWILLDYEELHVSFTEKVNSLSSKRRELQREFDTEIGIIIGEKRAQAKLLNNAIPLPTTVPSKAIMEEMIADQLCKVCNRPAKKGSKPYEFMLSRLEEYITSQIPINQVTDETEQLFTNDYTTKLVNLSSSHEDSLASLRRIGIDIKELFRFNEKQRGEIARLETALETEIQERDRIIGNSSIGQSKLQDVLKNYNGWQKDLIKQQKEESELKKEIDEINRNLKIKKIEKDKIDIQNANIFLIKTRSILRDIYTIFKDTREAKFDEFILLLQSKTNEFFSKINAGAFTGEVIFTRKISGGKPTVLIELQEDGRILHKPNQSLLTSMHISILFAISQLASDKIEEGYPMIFDAPTSSFGETKTGAFLNIISQTGNQIILLLKDFIVLDKDTNNLSIKPEFSHIKRDKAFWVKLERPFDSKVLKTINTEIISL
jgi:DNA sulfur modification protein DndD